MESLKEEILQLESKLMVLDKIVEQTDNDERENYHLLVEDFNNLRKENERLEKQLHKFYEKIGEVDYLSGLVTKHKEVFCHQSRSSAPQTKLSALRKSRTNFWNSSPCKRNKSASSTSKKANSSKSTSYFCIET